MPSESNQCVPLYRPGRDVTIVADGAISGRRCVKVNASKAVGTAIGTPLHVIQAVAGDLPDGVASWDLVTGETGEMQRGGVVPIDAGATVTAGQKVMVDATGRVITWVFAASDANNPIGKAWSDATVGNPCYVALSI